MDDGPTTSEGDHRSQEEADDAIWALTDGDILRMVAKGNVAALGTDLSGEDVFAQAVERIMSGARPWRANVPFEAHMTMVMKSIGSNRRRSMKAAPARELEDVDLRRDFANEVQLDDQVGSAVRTKRLLDAVDRVFADDQVGLALFLARTEGMPPEEACGFAEIGRDRYETVYKRVQRKIAKAVASGAFQ